MTIRVYASETRLKTIDINGVRVTSNINEWPAGRRTDLQKCKAQPSAGSYVNHAARVNSTALKYTLVRFYSANADR